MWSKVARKALPWEIVGATLVVVTMLWTGLLLDINRSKSLALAEASQDASNLAVVLREHVGRTMHAIDQLMIAIIADNTDTGNLHIPAWVKRSPFLGEISIQISMVNRSGVVVASDLGLSGSPNVSDRAPFRYHLDPAAPQPYISAPVIGRNSGKWSIQVSRRITLKDGSFGGMLVVSVNPFYFAKFFDSVDLGPRGVVDLIGRDGIIRARRGETNQGMGLNLADGPLFKKMQLAGAGTTVVRSKLDGIERVYGYAPISRYPLFVLVGLATEEVLAPIRRQSTLELAAGGFVTLVIIALGSVLAREVIRRRKRELAMHADEKIREQRALLGIALNNMQRAC
jgi:two-component system, NarL family, sensor histidine kinase BarA